MRAGKDVVTNPTQLLNLYKNGLYDPASLVKMINEQAFGVVVLRAQFYPEPVLQAIGQKVSHAGRCGHERIYLPHSHSEVI